MGYISSDGHQALIQDGPAGVANVFQTSTSLDTGLGLVLFALSS